MRELYKRYEWRQPAQFARLAGGKSDQNGSRGIKWTTTSIKGILTNEKYCGDVLLQKTFRADVISKKVIKNVGQMAQYYMPDHHEGHCQPGAVQCSKSRNGPSERPAQPIQNGCDRTLLLYQQICLIGQARVRRMRNTLPPMHMDLARTKISCLALHQPPELRHKILPRFPDDQGRTAANGDSGSRQLRHEQQTGPARPYQERSFRRASAGAGAVHEPCRHRASSRTAR